MREAPEGLLPELQDYQLRQEENAKGRYFPKDKKKKDKKIIVPPIEDNNKDTTRIIA